MVTEAISKASSSAPAIWERKRKFFHSAVADIFRCIDGKPLLAPFTLTFCLIDQMAWVEFGYVKNRFNRWIEKRMSPLNMYYRQSIEELYLVRCGLVHSYGPPEKRTGAYKGYSLLSCGPGFHLQRMNSPSLRVCLYSLVTDTVFATHKTFQDLENECSIGQLDRLDSQIQFPGRQFPYLYEEMHRALSCFDRAGEITLTDIRADYTREILYPQA